jgi:hypothetical protein
VAASVSDLGNGEITVKTPEEEGAYRLFFYVLDGNNHAATVNIPFYID